MSGRGDKPSRPEGRMLRDSLRTAQGRTLSSQRWLERQINDPYVVAARAKGYRSRAAFKLAQLDDKYKLIRPASRIIDLGAAPGGWTQVAVERSGGARPQPNVLAIDINPMDPVTGARFMQLDFLAPDAEERVIAAAGGLIDLVVSDMAAPATGHKQTDHLRIMALCEAAEFFAEKVLAQGGAFVCKVLKGGTENSLLNLMKKNFAVVRHAKPEASRADSAESYVVATGFRGGIS